MRRTPAVWRRKGSECNKDRKDVSVNKNNLHESKQDTIETFFLKNIRNFTKAWTFYILVLKTGRRGRFIYFHHKNIYQYSDWSSLLRCYDYLTIREKGWKLTSSLYHSQGSLHIICSPNTFVQRPLRQYRKSKGKTMVFSLIILVTGNRKMGGMAGLMPQPYVSVCLFDHTTVWPQATLFPKGRIQGGRVRCPVFRDPHSAGTWCSRDGRIAPSPLREAGRSPGGHAAGAPHRRRRSVRPMLSLFVLFVLFLVGTLGAEPLHLFWWCGH